MLTLTWYGIKDIETKKFYNIKTIKINDAQLNDRLIPDCLVSNKFAAEEISKFLLLKQEKASEVIEFNITSLNLKLKDIIMLNNSELIKNYIDKTIAEVDLNNYDEVEYLQIKFTDGTGIQISDNGQYCCEYRYMHTDDELDYYVGSTFTGVELSDGPELEEEKDGDITYHDQQFLKVSTNKGVFTIVTHNKHNGNYGGFNIEVSSF